MSVDSWISERRSLIESHRRLIMTMRGIEQEIERLLAASDSAWKKLETERNGLFNQAEPLISRYWDILPSAILSRCPVCSAPLARRFDNVDLNGFWWMDRTQRACAQPPVCPHFCLLLGALNLNGRPPSGGLFECRPGPDKPFVVPRMLDLPSMTAVVSQVELHCGYTAYPVAYFSAEPLAGRDLTPSWAGKEYALPLPDGRRGWEARAGAYEYDLIPWLENKKLRWIKDDHLQTGVSEHCPFIRVPGTGRPQIILDNRHHYLMLE